MIRNLISLIEVGHLRFEKCELKEAYESYLSAYTLAKEAKDSRLMAEALLGLLRFSGEALDNSGVKRWEAELERTVKSIQAPPPPSYWYSKGALAVSFENWKKAQRFFHHYIRSVKAEAIKDERERDTMMARGLTMVANALQQQGKLQRAKRITEILLSRYEPLQLRGINGVLFLLIGLNFEKRNQIIPALEWYRRAHAAFLGEHNWYHHLYVLLAYARISRLQRNYSQANFYLDLIDRAASTPEFGVLRNELKKERKRLEETAVDLLVDVRRGMVKTRDGGSITLRKQYVLLDILKALSKAHNQNETPDQTGLSKADIIRQVWKENYRPESHDNKLYYNINRLRKLIEPNFRQPRYLLNWKEGYRLAPGLRVHLVSLEEKRENQNEGVKP